MRPVLACLALLAVAASPRGGCGDGHPYDPCAAKACGAACTACAPDDRSCLETAVVKACDPAGACVAQGSFTCADADCAGAACGAPCNPCGLASPCPTLAATACDRAGHCAAATPWLCYEPCAGKACGAGCTLCPPGVPNCAETAIMKACDPSGACVAAGAVSCSADACTGKACGDRCTIDPPCRSATPPCMLPSMLGYCTASGGCVTAPPVCGGYP